MRIYKDVFSGDELFSDTLPIKLVDGIVYEVEGKMRVDTTTVSDEMIGGNKSAEGGDDDEGGDAASVSGVNIVLNHHLVEFPQEKKAYMKYIKEYMKKVAEHLKAENSPEIDLFQKNIQVFIKDVLANFGDYQFFCGEKMDADGMLALMKWKDDKPYMYFFKHGVIEEKV